MKILIISPYLPHESFGGSGLKLLFTLNTLKQKGKITLFTFYKDQNTKRLLNDISKKLNIEIISVKHDFQYESIFSFIKKPDYFKRFYNHKLNDIINNKIKDYDIIYGDSIFSYNYLKSFSGKYIIDLHNFHSELLTLKKRFSKNIFKKIILNHQKNKILKIENEILKNTKIKKIITGKIPYYLKKISNNHFSLIPFSFDSNIIKKTFNKKILFTGNFLWEPNKIALKNIIKIAEKLKDYRFIIAGKSLNSVKKDHLSNITYINNPENTENLFKDSSIFLCPVKYGSGLNIKILQGLNANMSVICFKETAERISLLKKYLISCSSIKEMINAIKSLDSKNLKYEITQKITENHQEYINFIFTSFPLSDN